MILVIERTILVKTFKRFVSFDFFLAISTRLHENTSNNTNGIWSLTLPLIVMHLLVLSKKLERNQQSARKHQLKLLITGLMIDVRIPKGWMREKTFEWVWVKIAREKKQKHSQQEFINDSNCWLSIWTHYTIRSLLIKIFSYYCILKNSKYLEIDLYDTLDLYEIF